MVEILITALTSFALYSFFVLLHSSVGAYQNINIWGMKFDWKLYLNGVVKWVVLGLIVIGSAVGAFLLIEMAQRNGVQIVDVETIAPKVIIALMALASAEMLRKIIVKLSTTLGLPAEALKAIQDANTVTPEGEDLPVFFADSTPNDVKAYVKEKLAQEKEDENIEGGIGAVYSVPIDNYGTFKNAVMGRGFDIDNFYGWQCWDGTALLWQQLGMSLITGNGLAIGCWDLKRDVNKGNQFDLVTDVNGLRAGDVVVMRPNHIGFFDGYEGNFMRILGQNQGGSPTHPSGGSAFNLTRVAKSAFAGAFRLRRWNVAPAPVAPPAPQPVPARKDVTDAVVEAVKKGDFGNGADRKINLANAGYDPQAVQNAVNASLANQPAPAPPANPSTVKYTYRTGDTFGQVILNLGLQTGNGLWGASGDVAYYTAQLHAQGIYGNIPVGTTITLVRRG